uniref:Restriction endonuclease subunit S n=1 Tax=Desulfatirhabdium butyrativorans TaxID=340467 RepID=A0A7C4RTT9_9BACT
MTENKQDAISVGTTHDKTVGATGRSPLPDGWRWVRLGDVIADAQAGFASGKRDPNGVIQLRMNNVDTRGNLVWNDVIRVPADAETIDHYRLVVGDVMFNNTNSIDLVGKSALFEGYNEPVVFSNHFTRIRPKGDVLISEFLASWLNHQWLKGVFANICNRWVGQSAVKYDRLMKIDFPLPPIPEQQRIASILREQMAAVEKARKAAEERLEAVNALPAAFLRQVFPQPGQPLPDGWKWVRLGDVCEFCRGPFGGSLRKDIFVKSGYPVYEQSHAIYKDFGNFRYYIDGRKYIEMSRFRVTPGDLIMSCSGTMGKVAVITKDAPEGIINQALLKLTPTAKVISAFLVFSIQSPTFQQTIEALTLGAAIKNVASVSIIKRISIPLPPLSEQQRIVAILREQMAAVEKARKASEEELAAINALPAALLRRAFSGEL